jgi:hypothetical protein
MRSGLRLRTLEIAWNTYEPQENSWNRGYIQQQQALYAQMRSAGFKVVLDFGIQYPPAWAFAYPDSSYVNQYGDTFAGGPGINGLNAVFNQTIRVHQARYIQRVFADLGADFYAVRLGGGGFNELMYPPASYKGHTNSYWAYDSIAQGQSPGLPPGMSPAPQIGWRPGTPSAEHATAAAFVDWYLNSLRNYHDWQIATVRQSYGGQLMMLYPSWGIRPGQLQAAITGDLSGQTSPELNGEIERGLDVARFVGGITDPKVVLYTTWLDASDQGDTSADPAQWSPAHYLVSLAAQHPIALSVWGENAGHNSYTDLQRCIKQVRTYGLQGMLWAFEPDLYTNTYATLEQLSSLIESGH